MPASISVGKFVTSYALSNPESHSHSALVNSITVAFNMTVAMEVVTNSFPHVECPINGPRRASLGAIEGEIPTTAAGVTASNPKVTSEVDMEGTLCVVLYKFAAL